MDTTNLNQSSNKSRGTGVCMGLVLLALGILIGVFGAKYVWPSTTRASNASGAGASAAAAAPASTTASISSPSGEWNPITQMNNIQAEVDRAFQRSFNDIHMNPKLKAFEEQPGYSLSMDVRDLKDRYQVLAFLPDTKTSDVKVNLEGNQLKVDVINKTTEKEQARNSETTTTELGHYEEVVQLAGALKDDRMKVERKAHELIITVPKV